MAGFLTGGGGAGGYAADVALGPVGWAMGAGGAMGMFGGNGPNFSGMQDLITQRQAQIDRFEQQLESARGNVLANYQDLQTKTMARFMPMAEANLAGRGLSVGGGAFASALAHEATGMQGQYDTMNANMTEKNLYDVQNLRSNLFGSQFQLGEAQTMIPYQQKQAMMQALGGLAGSGVGALMGGPMGAAAGGSAGRSVFGSNGPTDLSMTPNANGGYGNVPSVGGGYRNNNSFEEYFRNLQR